jgi:uncharacterized protein YgiB involved in biofilm formation
MKHSRRIALVLLGSVSALTLTACEDEKPKDGDPIYESAEQCRTLGGTQCDERWYNAVSDHVKTAPRYNSQESCLQQGHQNCSPVNAGGGSTSIWLPAMVGFMAGKMMSDSRPVYLQGYNDPRNDREREDRRVMAGGYHGGTTTPVMVGNYWDSGGSSTTSSTAGTSRPSLSQGMNAGAARAGWTATASNPNGAAVSQAGTVANRTPASVSRGAAVSSASASTSSAARGGFGGSGAGMGSSSGG